MNKFEEAYEKAMKATQPPGKLDRWAPRSMWVENLQAETVKEIVGKTAQKIWKFGDEYLNYIKVFHGGGTRFKLTFVVESIPVANQPHDPYGHYSAVVEHKKWDRLATKIKGVPGVVSAYWDSINSAQMGFYVEITPR